MLSSDKIIAFVRAAAEEEGVAIPPGMEESFRRQFGDLELESLNSVYDQLCKPLRAALKLPANQEFEPLFKSVSDAVRLRVGLGLGFAQAVTEASRGKPSIRSIFVSF